MTPGFSNSVSLLLLTPELLLAVGAVVTFLADLALRKSKHRRLVLCALAWGWLGAAAVATHWVAGVRNHGEVPASVVTLGLFGGLVALDGWAILFKYFACAATALSLWIAHGSSEISDQRIGEYAALLLSITVGMCLMASASDLLMIAIGIELVSLVSYALAGFRSHDRRSAEAALKYMVYGAAASGMMLFGMSYLYGLLGTTSLAQMRSSGAVAAPMDPAGAAVLLAALVFVLAGVGFKIASVPWHMWCPDVYEGAPTPFTAFLSVGPKAAGFALAVRLLYGTFGAVPGSVTGSALPWPQLVGLLSAVTMTVGNLAALSQTNLKRLLAYSSIAHAGYLLMGLAAASETGTASVALYLVVYLFMNLGAFLVVAVVATRTGSESLSEYRGLSSRAPFAAIALGVFLFSLTGLPPFAGFVGKFHLFKALVDAGAPWQLWLAVLGVLNSAVSLYYYARIIRTMFLEETSEARKPIAFAPSQQVLLAGLVAAVLVLGVQFDWLRRAADASTALWNATGWR